MLKSLRALGLCLALSIAAPVLYAAISGAFIIQSNTMVITTSATPSTATTTVINFPGTGASQMSSGAGVPAPNQVRVTNLGTAVVWISFTAAARTAAIPASGNTPVEIHVQPGGVEVLTVFTSSTINCNMISTAASQSIAVTFGEGL